MVGHAIPVKMGPRRAGRPADPRRQRRAAPAELGWRPRHGTIEEIIGSAWAWRRAHPAGYAE